MADAIDQFIALPQEERGKLFEQLAPEKQQSLLAEIKKRKSPGQPAGVLRAPTQRERFEMTYPVGRPGESVGDDLYNTAQNVGVGIWKTVEHPIDTITGVVKSILPGSDAPNPIEGAYDLANTKDVEAGAQAFGQGIALAPIMTPIAKLAGGMTRALTDRVKSVRDVALRNATKTGVAQTREVVRGTLKENEKIADKNADAIDAAGEKNKENAADHQTRVQDALSETTGRELTHAQALKAKAEEIRTQDAADAAKMKADHEKQLAEVKRANEEAVKAAEQKNSTAKEKYDAKVAEHEAETQAANTLNQSDRTFKAQIKNVYQDVKAKANEKYNALRGKLDDVAGDPEWLPNALVEASGKMRGSETMPKILQDMETKVKHGDTITFNDLQGYRSEIGDALSTRGLPDDVYYAYKGLMGDIDEEMARIAKSKSPALAKQLTEAREYYKKYAQAFLDRSSPLRKILDDPEPHGFLHRVRNKEVSGVGAIRQFDPALAGSVQSALDLMDRIRMSRNARFPFTPPEHPGAAPVPVEPALKPEPQSPAARLTSGTPEERAAQEVKQPDRVGFPERPAVVDPKLKPGQVVTPDSLSAAKRARAIDRSSEIRNSSQHLATVFVALDAVRTLFSGNFLGLGEDVAARVGYAAAKERWADYLESPKVLDAVSRITEKDVKEVMKLPANQRAGFDQLLLQAQTKGVTLRPGVTGALFGVASIPAVAGDKTKHLKQLRDSHAYTDAGNPSQ